jgi:hypothetical protein
MGPAPRETSGAPLASLCVFHFILTSFLADRYDMNCKLAGSVALFFANIATARCHQVRELELGISSAEKTLVRHA